MNDRPPNLVVLVGLAAVLVAFGVWFWAGRRGSEMNAGAELAKAIVGFRQTLDRAQQEPRLPGEPEALARVENTRLAAFAESTAKEIEAAATAQSRWHEEIETLLQNDDGRALATAPDLVQAFDDAWRHDHPPEWRASVARTQVQALLEPVARGAADRTNTITASEAFAHRLGELRASAERARVAYDRHRERVAIVVARSRSRELAPGSVTLAVALEATRSTQDAVNAIRAEGDAAINRAKAASSAYQQLYARHLNAQR